MVSSGKASPAPDGHRHFVYHMWKAAVGLNCLRPIIVGLLNAAVLPRAVYVSRDVLFEGSQRRVALLIAVLGGVGIAYFSSLFLQPGR